MPVRFAVAALALSTAAVLAQTAPSKTAQTAAQSIAAAESAGRAFAHAPGVDPSTRKCVDVDALNAREITSGDFTAGPFPVRARFVNFSDPSKPGMKMHFIPAHGEGLKEGSLAIHVSRIDGVSDEAVWTTSEWTISGAYMTGEFLADGRWLFVATAGVNWGCFVGEKK